MNPPAARMQAFRNAGLRQAPARGHGQGVSLVRRGGDKGYRRR
jgi:hypothetical protein